MNADKIMTKAVYLFDIARCDRAQDLHNFAEFAATDPELLPQEREEIQRAIANKFGRMNAEKRGKQKPRWGA